MFWRRKKPPTFQELMLKYAKLQESSSSSPPSSLRSLPGTRLLVGESGRLARPTMGRATTALLDSWDDSYSIIPDRKEREHRYWTTVQLLAEAIPVEWRVEHGFTNERGYGPGGTHALVTTYNDQLGGKPKEAQAWFARAFELTL